MYDDLAALDEYVEHRFRILSGAHGEVELRVVGVGEPVDLIQGQARVGTGPVRSEIEDTASSDGGQLMAVPDQREVPPQDDGSDARWEHRDGQTCHGPEPCGPRRRTAATLRSSRRRRPTQS